MTNNNKNIFSINDKEKVGEYLEDKRKQEKEVEETLRKNTETAVENAKQVIRKAFPNG
ncbi:TPA: hypothetical protein ACLBZV_005561 [Bacillus cereus]|uniref:hypothetical protein n=1 Tax=Bacillus cereus TaxID=1396 RepID=UPI001783464F|nr:hypothetical protein [Bacillus cereus]BCC15190.1 hypothetical protein BCM0074_p310 [Bacillus cereus]HDR6306423.1 hypothetical protein [Bacillus cereus]